jgi:hypothetical protein
MLVRHIAMWLELDWKQTTINHSLIPQKWYTEAQKCLSQKCWHIYLYTIYSTSLSFIIHIYEYTHSWINQGSMFNRNTEKWYNTIFKAIGDKNKIVFSIFTIMCNVNNVNQQIIGIA